MNPGEDDARSTGDPDAGPFRRPPEDVGRLVLLRSYQSPFVAELHAALLEERGIEAFVMQDQVWPTLRMFDQGQDAQLMVPESRLDEARVELDDIIRNPPEIADEEAWRLEADRQEEGADRAGAGRADAPPKPDSSPAAPRSGEEIPHYGTPIHMVVIAILGLILVIGTSLGVILTMFF